MQMATVYNNKAYCLVELGNLKDALPLVNKALELDAGLYYIWDTRGEIDYKMGSYAKCISDMTNAIEIEQHDNSYYYRAMAELKLNLKAKACDDLSKAGELGNAEAYKVMKNKCH